MKNKVKCFKGDEWKIVDATSLVADDLIFLSGKTYVVTDKPYKKDGKTHIPATPYEEGEITLALGDLGDSEFDYLYMAMDYAMSSLVDFKDGTFMICDLGESTFVYSPRLPKAELNEFCKKHIDKYKAFYDEHGHDEDCLQYIKKVEIERFW